jgi:hypothetical protein
MARANRYATITGGGGFVSIPPHGPRVHPITEFSCVFFCASVALNAQICNLQMLALARGARVRSLALSRLAPCGGTIFAIPASAPTAEMLLMYANGSANSSAVGWNTGQSGTAVLLVRF